MAIRWCFMMSSWAKSDDGVKTQRAEHHFLPSWCEGGFERLLPCEYSEQETTCCGLRVGVWLLLVRIRIRASSIPMVAKE